MGYEVSLNFDFIGEYDSLPMEQFIRVHTALYRQACFSHILEHINDIVPLLGSKSLHEMLENPEKFAPDDIISITGVKQGSITEFIKALSDSTWERIFGFLKIVVFHDQYKDRLIIENLLAKVQVERAHIEVERAHIEAQILETKLIDEKRKITNQIINDVKKQARHVYGVLPSEIADKASSLAAEYTLELLDALKEARCSVRIVDADNEINPHRMLEATLDDERTLNLAMVCILIEKVYGLDKVNRLLFILRVEPRVLQLPEFNRYRLLDILIKHKIIENSEDVQGQESLNFQLTGWGDHLLNNIIEKMDKGEIRDIEWFDFISLFFKIY